MVVLIMNVSIYFPERLFSNWEYLTHSKYVHHFVSVAKFYKKNSDQLRLFY